MALNDTTVQALDRLDLTNAQKRDERFYPTDAVVVFNQKVREAEPGAKGKLAGIVKSGVLVEVDGRFVTVSNKMLDRISRSASRANCRLPHGDRLHLKANRKLASGGRVTNGELVTVKVGPRGWRHRADRWPGVGRELPRIPARLRRHVLRLAGQNRGLRPVLRFDHQGRDQCAAMVCDHLARSAWHPHLHAGQSSNYARMSRAPVIARWRWNLPVKMHLAVASWSGIGFIFACFGLVGARRRCSLVSNTSVVIVV